MSFIHFYAPKAIPSETDLCLIVHADRIVARPEVSEKVSFPECWALSGLEDVSKNSMHVGLMDGRPVWLCVAEKEDSNLPIGWHWHDTRALISVLTPDQSQAISCARQLLWWERRHRFCGACGTPMLDSDEERARRCPKCSAIYYPVVSPAVIVAVTRGDEILLAHNRNFRSGMFSILAGFVDPGESLEQTVKREVREEVGVEIDDLRYVASQPWPFPNSLMLGFRARYVSGEITANRIEIEEARWYTRTTLPEIPRKGTIARLLIDQWLRDPPSPRGQTSTS